MSSYILTIDQGTTSSRAILFNQKGEMKGIYQMEFAQIRRANGYVEHNAFEIFDSVMECIKNVLINSNVKADEINAIGITNQRETAVLFDKKTGYPVCDAICWQSKQSANICDKLIQEGYEEKIFNKTGLHINPYFSASKIRYMLDNYPDVKKKYDNNEILFGTIDSYLLYRLSGLKSHFTDVTNASRTLLFNINTLDYDDELLELFDLKRNILPKVLKSSDDFGDATIDGVKIPICALVGDQQASLFGHCAFEVGAIKNTYGTGCFMLLNTGLKPFYSQKGLLSTIAYQIDDKPLYALEGSVFVGGAAISWLRDGIKIIDSSRETEDRARLSQDNDLIVVPTFVGMGTPYWDNEVRGAMFGITLSTNQESIIKATLEAIAYQSMDVLLVMRKEANVTDISISVDGGASANNYLMQFQADIMQTPIKMPNQIETTALGACFLAGLKTGFFANLEEIKQINQTKKCFYPQITIDEANKLYSRWEKAIKATRMFK